MTEGFVTVQGMNLFYVTEGEGIPVLYIHGNTGSSAWFYRVMNLPGYKTYALDMPNFGRSSELPGEVDLHRYADVVKGFAEALKLENPIVVAHSLGGAVAQSLAVRYPEMLRALVLIDSSAPNGLVTPKEHYPLIEMMRGNRAVLYNALKATVPTLEDEVFFELLVNDATLMAPKAWVGNAAALGSFNVSDKTSAFTKPVLVIWGRKDGIITEKMAQDTATAYPAGSLKIIEGVGHSVLVENPPLFKNLLKDFFAGLTH